MKYLLLLAFLASVLFINGCSGKALNNNTVVVDKFKPSAIVIYSTQNAVLTPIKELPNYEAGNVLNEPILTYQDWINGGGHQPWRKDPYSVVQVLTSNLVPGNISTQQNMGSAWVEHGNTTENKDSIVIKLISPENDTLHNSSNADKDQFFHNNPNCV